MTHASLSRAHGQARAGSDKNSSRRLYKYTDVSHAISRMRDEMDRSSVPLP
jgi:hypothetical protein